MPRGGGRKVTQICSRIYAFPSLTRLLFVAAVPHDKKRNPIHLFFSCFRARVYLLSQRWSSLSLFVSCGAFEREIGFSKTRALRKRERERETNFGWCGFRSPQEGKKEREKTNTLDLTQYEKKCTKREEEKNESTAKTKHIEERKRKRERERECFLREKRDIFPPFSLSFLWLPRREERVEKQTDIFRITAWHWPHLSLSLLLLHATMK